MGIDTLQNENVMTDDGCFHMLVTERTGSDKSSLINALAGRFVSEVGVIPTIQTPVEQEITEGGLPLRVVDLPGVGEAGRHEQRLEDMLGALGRAHLMLMAVPYPSRDLAYERELVGPLLARSAARILASQLCKFVPVAGSLAGAAVAGALIYSLGMAFHTLMHGGSWHFDTDTLLQQVEKVWSGLDKDRFLDTLKQKTGETFSSWKK